MVCRPRWRAGSVTTGGAAAIRVEVLYFEGCPSCAKLLPRLRELVSEAGGDPEGIEMRIVDSVGEAEEHHFLGSPTVCVNGRDVEPGAGGRGDFGLKCRVYRSVSGQAALPPEAWIREALADARS